MPVNKIQFKGHEYTIDDQDKLHINDKFIEVSKEEFEEGYYTPLMPYQVFASLEELAKKLITCSPEYKTFDY